MNKETFKEALNNFENNISQQPIYNPFQIPFKGARPVLVDRLKNEVTKPIHVPDSDIFYFFAQSHLIGKGSSSLVFSGYYLTPDKKAAVKLIECEDDDADINELRIWENILSANHSGSEGVVGFYGCSMDANILYICMELATCNPEYDLKYNFDHYPDYPRISGYMKNLAAGLEYLHDNNIIHRDIKPQNVFIFHKDEQKIAKLGDLGLSRELSNSEGSVSFSKGTKMWMSPEALRAMDDEEEFRNTKAMDIFSFGLVIVYALCFRKHPCAVNGKLLVNIKNNMEVELPTEMSSFRPVEHLTTWMLKKDPSRRPTITQCRAHPFLWENEEEKILEFFGDILKATEIPNRDDENLKDCYIVHYTIKDCIALHYYSANSRLRNSLKVGVSWRWTENIDPILMHARSNGIQSNLYSLNLWNGHKYNEYSPMSLLKFILDRDQNPENMVEGVVSKLFSEDGSDENFNRKKFCRYVINLYPELVWMLVFTLAKLSPECQILNELQIKYLKELVVCSEYWNCAKGMDELMNNLSKKLKLWEERYSRY